jgi:hypothetical protein
MGAVRKPGRHWVVAAVGMLTVPVAVYLLWSWTPALEACVAVHGDDVKPGGPCWTPGLRTTAALLWLYAAVPATILVGLPIGFSDGRNRRRFASGRRVCAVVVGLASPWALLAYALAYGLARLLPVGRPGRAELAHRQGRQAAAELARWLDRDPPPVVTAPGFLGPGPVHLDVAFSFARYRGMDVTYSRSSTFAYGSPTFVAGAMIGNMIGNGAARRRAEALARAQWREIGVARVVLTATTTWCAVDGRWIAFDHEAVMEYTVQGASCVLTFADSEPLRLTGPAAWCHAVLFAYARFGPQGWRDAAFLWPLLAAPDVG